MGFQDCEYFPSGGKVAEIRISRNTWERKGGDDQLIYCGNDLE